MKQRMLYIIIAVFLSLSFPVRALAGCSGQLTCLRWDAKLSVCTTVNQSKIDCVESGGACQWGGDCDKCPSHGSDCTGTADGTTPSPPPGGGGGASCFPAGTQVMMENGEARNIEQVRAGDRVISQSETGERALSRVTEIETPVRDHLCTVQFVDGGRLRMTDEHPVFTQEGWKSIVPENTAQENPNLKVFDLTSRDTVQRADGSTAQKFHSQCPPRVPW